MQKIEIVFWSILYCFSMGMIGLIFGTDSKVILSEVIGSLGLMVTLCLCSPSR